MFRNLLKNYVYPTVVLSGGAVGVGFLSLPYIAMRAGFLLTVLYIFAMAAIIIVIHLVFAKISLATPDFKRLPGFVKHYLGGRAQTIAFLSAVLGYFGVLLAYLIVGGEFLTSALSPIFGGNNFIYTLVYFILGTIVIAFGIRTVSRVELVSLVLLFLSLVFIAIKQFSDIKTGNLLVFPQPGLKMLFLPYGPALFSLWGLGLIPETEEMLRGRKKTINKIIIAATIIPAVIYLLFTVLILGITGAQTTESALSGLKAFLGNGLFSFALLVGAVVTFVAFCVQGLTFKKVLNYDLKIKQWQALVIACFTPMILFLLGLKHFIPIISVVGGVFLGIDGILIMLMYKKIKRKSLIIYPLLCIFLLGIIYQIIYFIT